MSLRIRLATADDAAAICRVYNQGIEDRGATRETEPRTADERRAWLGGRTAMVLSAFPTNTGGMALSTKPGHDRDGRAAVDCSPL